MSDSSLENSGIDTAGSIRSGVSLGQCIKLNAQESNGAEWHELQPSFDKNWHTLQGVVTSEITMDEVLDEASFNDGSSRIKSNNTAIPPLLLHGNLKNNTSDSLETSNLPKLLSSDVGVLKRRNSNNSLEATLRSNNQDDVANAMMNILQNDDSLAQRVRDLLEEDSEEKVLKLDVVVDQDPADLRPPHPEDYKDVAQIDDGLKVLSESNYQPSTGRTSLNTDIFASLNESVGTEYGDLPETVDIPKDIVKHLENMRLLSNETVAKQAWQDSKRDEVNIKGGVGYHLGSNPTTPQFPIEEDKLSQLQTYIEKKTGLPVISPLVLGEMSSREVQAKTPSLLTATDDNLTVEAFQSNRSETVPNNEVSPSTLEERYQNRTESAETSDNYANLERIEPEGMSPPMDHVAASTPVTHENDEQNKENATSGGNPDLPIGRSSEIADIDDDVLIARIRQAWSEPKSIFTPNSSLVRQPDQSFAESVDSLALHVKALLEEEFNSSVLSGDDPHQTSNLSEVIETFENTELWKYVRQFLPRDNSLFNNLPADESSLDRSSFPEESEINNSLLDKIREEFRRENEMKKGRTESTPEEEIATRDSALQISSNKKQSTPHQNLDFESGLSLDENSFLLEPRSVDQKQSVDTITPPYVTQRNYSNPPKYSDGSISSHKSPLVKFDRKTMESIPGIPDFCRSVITPTSDSKRRSILDDYHPVNSKKISPRISENARNSPSLVPVVLNDHEKGENKSEHDIRVSSFHTDVSEYSINSDHDDESVIQSPKHDLRSPPMHSTEKPIHGTHASLKSISSPIKPREDRIKLPREPYSSYGDLQQTPTYQPRSSYFSNSERLIKSPSKPKNEPKQIKYSDVEYGLQRNRQHSNAFVPSITAGSGKNSVFPKPKSSAIRSPTKTNPPLLRTDTLGRPTPNQFTPNSMQPDKSAVNLPTFEELMEEQRSSTKGNSTSSSAKSKSRNSENDVDLIPTSDKSPDASEKVLNETFTEDKTTPAAKSLKRSSTSEVNDSTRAQIPSKSYQETTLPSSHSCNLLLSESDLDVHRRTISTQSSGSDRRSDDGTATVRGIPQSLSEFERLGVSSQRKVVRQILEWARDRKSATRRESPDVASLLRRTSCSSNPAMYDSDSTEYCDLPSSKSASTRDEEEEKKSSRSILGVDESKAERILKRLLGKIEMQKSSSSSQKKREHSKRLKASTPQHVRRAVSKETTDSEGPLVQLIQIPHKQHAGKKKKKIAIINDDSESSDPIVLQVRRTKNGQIIVLDRSMQTHDKKERKPLRNVSTNFPSPIQERKKTVAIQTTINQTNNSIKDNEQFLKQKMMQETENIEDQRPERISSYFVKVPQQHASKNNKKASKPTRKPIKKPMAWYEPYKYEPAWKKSEPEKIVARNENTNGLVQVSLQEALQSCLPDFVSKSRERQRRIQINSEERKMQEVWAEERERVFGGNQNTKQQIATPPVLPRRRPEISRKQMVSETKEKYNQLPEVVRRRYEEARKKEYNSNRLKAQLYQKKIQRQLLGRGFNLS